MRVKVSPSPGKYSEITSTVLSIDSGGANEEIKEELLAASHTYWEPRVSKVFLKMVLGQEALPNQVGPSGSCFSELHYFCPSCPLLLVD